MKYLAIVLLLISCTNNKARIVEQIKSYKDSIRITNLQISLIKSTAFQRHDSVYKTLKTNFDADYKTLQKDNIHNEQILRKHHAQEKELQLKEMIEKNNLSFKILKYRVIIDSLNLELKKY